MKAKLIFNLPEDKEDYDIFNNALAMYSVIWEMDQWLRSNTKYADDNLSSDKYDAYQECRDKLRELLSEEEIKL